MVKGTGKRVIIVKSPDPRVFEEAIFIIREDFMNRGGVSQDEIMVEAQKAANEYLKSIRPGKGRFSFLYRLPAPFIAAAGAAAAGLAWLASKITV